MDSTFAPSAPNVNPQPGITSTVVTDDLEEELHMVNQMITQQRLVSTIPEAVKSKEVMLQEISDLRDQVEVQKQKVRLHV